jgi:hypothetical protein
MTFAEDIFGQLWVRDRSDGRSTPFLLVNNFRKELLDETLYALRFSTGHLKETFWVFAGSLGLLRVPPRVTSGRTFRAPPPE